MPDALATLITTWRNTYNAVWVDLTNFGNGLGDAAVQCDFENWSGLALSFRNLEADVLSLKSRFKNGTPNLYTNLHYCMFWINDNWPAAGEEYELTWKKIAEAWIANDFEGRAVTIAVIDRMRQILWNEPFKATWAARPETGI